MEDRGAAGTAKQGDLVTVDQNGVPITDYKTMFGLTNEELQKTKDRMVKKDKEFV